MARQDAYDDDAAAATSDDDTRTDEIEQEPIALPGHSRPPSAPYHGPQFPPQVRVRHTPTPPPPPPSRRISLLDATVRSHRIF